MDPINPLLSPAALALAVGLGWLAGAGTLRAAAEWSGQPGVHHVHPAPPGHMVHAGGERVLLFAGSSGRVSTDGGRSWGDPFTLVDGSGSKVSLGKVIRLASGRLAGLGSRRGQSFGGVEGGAQLQYLLRVSEDEGRTWSEPRAVKLPEERYHVKFNRDAMIQLRTGRILVPMCNYFGKVPEYDFAARPFLSQGLWGSHLFFSDDEGLTWDRTHDDVVVHMADSGGADTFATFVEPAAVELGDGEVMMVGRTRLGQLFQSISSDGGLSWSVPAPMGLTASYAPAEIVRIPPTGDLLIAWNQVSRSEVRDGLGRHRLTVAISADAGRTWGNHKNLYALDDANYLAPEAPQPTLPGEHWIKYGTGAVAWQFDAGIGKVGTRGDVGAENVYVLPEDDQRYHRRPASLRTCYPRICVTEGHVLVSYQMGKPGPITNARDIFPVEWLYEPLVPPGPYARLVCDGEAVAGADISMEDGTAFGWADAIGRALGVEARRMRVPVGRFLATHGARVAPDGWRPDDGPAGTLHILGP